MQQGRLSTNDPEFVVNLKRLGISNTEIAHKMGISEGTVRYRIKRFESGATGINSYLLFQAGHITSRIQWI